MAFVPLPPPPPPPPVVKKPPVGSASGSPLGFCPNALQTIIWFAGNAGEGVQVRMVFPPLHTSVVVKFVKYVMLIKSTPVKLVSIGSLKTKTNAADGDAPLAGSGEIMVGSASAVCKQPDPKTEADSTAKHLFWIVLPEFMPSIQVPELHFVTWKNCGCLPATAASRGQKQGGFLTQILPSRECGSD